MCRFMNKLRMLPIKISSAHIIELNNYLKSLPGSKNSSKMEGEYMNNIMLHDIPNGWAK